jgi:hypothetical protein
MPFTPAHIAAALPLRNSRLVWSALIIGTIAPDFEYFLRLAPDDGYGHTFAGSFLLTLPLAILTLWLFHAIVKKPLIKLLPDGIQRRLKNCEGEFCFEGLARFALIVMSILLGMLTHLLWDSFTHPNTWLYRTWPILRQRIYLPLIGPTPIYKVFQHGSTILGMGALLIALLLWYRTSEISTEPATAVRPWPMSNIMILVAVTATALLGGAIRAIAAIGFPWTRLEDAQFAGLLVVTSIALLWWELVLYGLLQSKDQNADPSLRSG